MAQWKQNKSPIFANIHPLTPSSLNSLVSGYLKCSISPLADPS